MIFYPSNIDPVAFRIMHWPVYWYGIMYLISFILGWLILNHQVKASASMNNAELTDLLGSLALGVIIGGHFGYLLFYHYDYLQNQPLAVFKPWQGGMSFHGGLIGVLVAIKYHSYKYKTPFLRITDLIAPIVPIGLGLGRIGNFINGELWGRVTTMPWGMVFNHVDLNPRHPSQLYEFCLEGVLLLVVLNIYARRSRPLGKVSGCFLLWYALCRIAVECWREPDVQIGLLWQCITLGQLLSIPMLLIGVALLMRKNQSCC